MNEMKKACDDSLIKALGNYGFRGDSTTTIFLPLANDQEFPSTDQFKKLMDLSGRRDRSKRIWPLGDPEQSSPSARLLLAQISASFDWKETDRALFDSSVLSTDRAVGRAYVTLWEAWQDCSGKLGQVRALVAGGDHLAAGAPPTP